MAGPYRRKSSASRKNLIAREMTEAIEKVTKFIPVAPAVIVINL
jgi:hypothetical protein